MEIIILAGFSVCAWALFSIAHNIAILCELIKACSEPLKYLGSLDGADFNTALYELIYYFEKLNKKDHELDDGHLKKKIAELKDRAQKTAQATEPPLS